MLLYLHSALARLLLANAVGLRMVLSGAVSLGQVIQSLVCNTAVTSLIPDASVPGAGVCFVIEHQHILCFISNFASSYRV